jgi:hypothetical protein
VQEFIKVDGVPKGTKQWNIIKNTFSKRSLFGLIKDAFSAWRAFR